MAETATAAVETNEERRASKLARLARRDLSYRNKVAAQAEQRLRARNKELEQLGFEPVASTIIDPAGLSDAELEQLASGSIEEA